MRAIACVLALLATTPTASAQFLGGYADGINQSRQIEMQRRALEIDQQYGTSHYRDLQHQQQMDELNAQLRRQNQLLEQQRMDRLIRGR
ncbi:MAG TPA: hypothetical protein VFI87_12050 [Hyphomicrobiaceae bacterium]|nr:hypothetical protein [Hyphomicrobiaceae bacterium]